MPMIDRQLVFLDLETTGASPGSDRITEVGLVEFDRGECLGEWDTLVNPGRSIPTNIQSLTGITDAMVADAPPFREIAEALHRRLQGKVLVAHNARFDHGFLAAEFRRVGLRYEPEILCTVRLSRKLFPEHPRHNLDSIIDRHGLDCGQRHRALGDARVLLQFLREISIDPGREKVGVAIDELLRKPALPPNLAPGALDDLPESPGVYVFHGADESALFVGRAMNLSSRVRAHFNGDSRSGRDRRLALDVARVEWVPTAGELGATIRHAQLVDRLAPAFNRKPARREIHCALRWDPVDGPAQVEFVDTGDPAFPDHPHLFGPFRTRRVAANALRELADTHALCHLVLGIERGKGPCLGHRLGHCRGACVGAESMIAHAMRMTQALQPLRLRPWPFPGPVGLRERDLASGRTEIHVFDRWRRLASVDGTQSLAECLQTRVESAFDYETYRLLLRWFDDPPGGMETLRLARSPAGTGGLMLAEEIG